MGLARNLFAGWYRATKKFWVMIYHLRISVVITPSGLLFLLHDSCFRYAPEKMRVLFLRLCPGARPKLRRVSGWKCGLSSRCPLWWSIIVARIVRVLALSLMLKDVQCNVCREAWRART